MGPTAAWSARLSFTGSEGLYLKFRAKGCTHSSRFPRRKAFQEGKHTDNEWIAHYAASCLTGNALRWYEDQADEVQDDWKLLRKALLVRFPAPEVRSPKAEAPRYVASTPHLSITDLHVVESHPSSFPQPRPLRHHLLFLHLHNAYLWG